MKKIGGILSAGAMGALMFMPTACEDYVTQYDPQKPEEVVPEVVKVEKSFTAKVDVPSVKTTISDGENNTKIVAWEAGDEFNVYWGAAEGDFGVAATANGGASAEFKAEVAEVDNYAAVYPTTTSAVFAEATKVNVTIPAVQDGSFANAGVMAAVTGKDAMSFAFENIGAILKFTVEKENVAQVVFKAKEAIGGVVEMTFGTGAPAVSVSGDKDMVTFPSANVGAAVTPGEYYICVAPVALADGLTVTTVTTDGGVLAMNTIDAIETLERSYLYDLGQIDEIDPSTITEYFVTVEGAGAKTGTNWTNAMSAADLAVLLKADSETVTDRGGAINGKKVHLAEGKYVLADAELKYFPVDFTGFAVPVAVEFIGGYSAANPEQRDPAKTPTVFSGDKQYAGFVIGENVNFTFDGVTFADAAAIDDAELITTTRGAVFVNSSTATLAFNDCVFKDNVDRTSQSTGNHGGAAILLKNGKVYADGCVFVGNVSGSRGGVIRTDSIDGQMFLNDCVFTGNSIWKDSYGMCIFAKGNLGINKCIFVGNTADDETKNNPSLNLNWNYVMINSTILDDSFFSSGTGTIRTETVAKDGYKAAIMNNIIGNTHPADEANKAWAILVSKEGLASKGYNLLCGKDNGISHPARMAAAETDEDVTSMPATWTFNQDTYELTWNALGFKFADNAAVEAMLRSSDMVATKGIATFAADFADWLKSINAL